MDKAASATERINEERMVASIRKSWKMFYRESSVLEVRIFLRSAASSSMWTGYGQILSGYFDDVETLVRLLPSIEKSVAPEASYVTLNPVDPVLKSRSYNKLRAAKRGESTPDNNIQRRTWLMIDFDPIRPKGISATDAEVSAAFDRAMEVAEALRKLGWPEPAVVCSGNGYHLYYPINMGNTDVSASLLSDVLSSIQLQFGDKEKKDDLGSAVRSGEIGVKIDPGVFNASRLTKLAGSWARKGDQDEEQTRLHRQSYVLSEIDHAKTVSMRHLEGQAQIYRDYENDLKQERTKSKGISGERESIIARFKREHPIEEIMEAHGYTHVHGDRYNRPDGDGKSVLVDREAGRSKHFSTNDPLYGQRPDAFEYETRFNFAGDQQAAIKHWSTQYGIPLRGDRQNGSHRNSVHLNGSAPPPPNLENFPSEPQVKQSAVSSEAPTAELKIVGSTEVGKIIFETFVQNMRLRAASIFNRETMISCMYDDETGHARLLHLIVGNQVAYDYQEEAWYWYNNLYWQVHDKSNINHLASEVLRYCYDMLYTRIVSEIAAMDRIQAKDRSETWADDMRALEGLKGMAYRRSRELCNITKVRNSLLFAMAEERFGISGDEWDKTTGKG